MRKINDFFKNTSVKVKGLENLPLKGTNIYVANHTCMLDIFLVPYVIDKPAISIVSCNSLFRNGERKELYNKYLTPFPLEVRAGKNYTDVCMQKIIDLLKKGKDIIFFPEGVFSDGTYLFKSHTGIARILFTALKDNPQKINIVPISIKIMDLTKEKQSLNYPWDDFQAEISILKPFVYDKYYERFLKEENKKAIWHELVNVIMKQIASSLNIPMLDEYGKLYSMEGFYMPSGKLVEFTKLPNEKIAQEYYNDIDKLYQKIVKE